MSVNIPEGVGVAASLPQYGFTFTYGTVVPTDATAGFAHGCVHVYLTGTAGASVYTNDGDVTSCAFKPLAAAGSTGAANVGIADAGGYTTAATVEAALAELLLTETSAQGFIHLPLDRFRVIASNDIPASGTPDGGVLSVDTAPKLIRVSTSTDKAERILWIGGSAVEIATTFAYPPDMDVTANYTVNLRCLMSASADTPVITVGLFEGIGDTTRGGNTAALGSTLATKSVTITPSFGHPNVASLTLVPGTHATDSVYLYEVYVLYKKKKLAS